MEENSGAKVLSVRMTRRLSLEQNEDTKSPAPATPTKKRGRLAKPLLDNIDENGPVLSPRRATRAVSGEAVEDKTLTPLRRTTRRSISKDTIEEKVSTPAKRITRRSISKDTIEEKVSTPAKRITRRSISKDTNEENVTTPAKRITRRSISKDTIEAKVSTPAKRITRRSISKDTIDEKVFTPAKRAPRRSMSKEQNEENVLTPKKNMTRTSISNIIEEKIITPLKRKSISKDSVKENVHTLLTPVNSNSSIESPRTKEVTRTISDGEDKTSVTPRQTRKSKTDMSFNENEDGEDKTSVTPRQTRKSKTDMSFNENEDGEDKTSVTPRQTRKSKTDMSFNENEDDLVSDKTKRDNLKDSFKEENNDDPKTSTEGEKSNNVSPSSVRKSPRLVAKCNKTESLNELCAIGSPNAKNEVDITHGDNKENTGLVNKSNALYQDNVTRQHNRKTTRKSEILNKTTSSIDKHSSTVDKRHRTKSLSNINDINLSIQEGKINHSDNENFSKNRNKKSKKSVDGKISELGSGDSRHNYFNDDKGEEIEVEKITNQSNDLLVNTAVEQNRSPKSSFKMLDKSSSNMDYHIGISSDKKEKSSPGAKNSHIIISDLEDQCVPVVHKNINTNFIAANAMEEVVHSNNISCEPMDIDETLPENISLSQFSQSHCKSINSENISQKDDNISRLNSSHCRSIHNNDNINTSNSSRKSLSKQKNKDLNHSSNSYKLSLNNSVSSVNSIQKNDVDINIIKENSILLNISDSKKDKRIKKLSISTLDNKSPLKHNNLQNLGLQTSTPNKNEMELNESSNLTKKRSSIDNTTIKEFLEKHCNDDSVHSSKNNSLKKTSSEYFDNEADDAGEDYESGDSQDTEEQQYNEQNEIVDRGETLSSENDDMSDDSDYEKGSFVVSSDEEDNDLLSGSGDDLNFSDNELTMSAKSKKKYDERKKKEQKQASREMFDSRHSESKNNKHTTKESNLTNGFNTDTSSDEDFVPTKRHNRQRINSTVDEEINNSKHVSVDKPDSLCSLETSNQNNKKHTKRRSNKISESSFDNNIISEHEMTTIFDKSTLKAKDPLSNSFVIKAEPKTPQKQLDISSINFTCGESAGNKNKKQTSITEHNVEDGNEASDSDDLSISEDEEIMENYDNVLNALKTIQTKAENTSINKLLSPEQKEGPVIDEINISQTKLHNQNKGNKESIKNCKKNNRDQTQKEQSYRVSDDSSDSIDLQLLFTENSDTESYTKINMDKSMQDEDFILIKKSEAKTNIPVNSDLQKSDNIESSIKKKKKNRTSKNTSESELEIKELFRSNLGSESCDNMVTKESPQRTPKTKHLLVQSSIDTNHKEISITNILPASNEINIKQESRKRKRNSSVNVSEDGVLKVMAANSKDVSLPIISQKKKLKQDQLPTQDNAENTKDFLLTNISQKKKLKQDQLLTQEKESKSIPHKNVELDLSEDNKEVNKNTKNMKQGQKTDTNLIETKSTTLKNKLKKRKRDDDEIPSATKVFKENPIDSVHVRRLPSAVLAHLGKEDSELDKKPKVISTANFHVEQFRQRESKPSQYLEDSIHIDSEEFTDSKHKGKSKKSKLLRFLPTASTSAHGFTTTFQINVIPKDTKFIAQANPITNFKNDSLYGNRIRRMGTYQMYKQRHARLEKF